MEFMSVIKKRRSVRKYTEEKVPEEVVRKAFECAILAPNSSNIQAWNFYWVRNQEKKQKLVYFCLNQSAAKTASDLVVVVASPSAWRRSRPELIGWAKSVKAPQSVIDYYEKLIPMMYMWGWLNLLGFFKKLIFAVTGFFKPVPRGPAGKKDIQEVCIKSAALAAENFVLAITDQGYSTCMMEGFDESRVKNLLKLKYSERVVMVISVGKETEKGAWGPQFRLGYEKVVHEV